MCIWKHVSSEFACDEVVHTFACDEVVHTACTAYNYVTIEHSKEGTFFLIFGRDAYTPFM